MPDSFGKRHRREVKAKKAAAFEERRIERARRRQDRAAGLIEPGSPVQAAEEPPEHPRSDEDAGADASG